MHQSLKSLPLTPFLIDDVIVSEGEKHLQNIAMPTGMFPKLITRIIEQGITRNITVSILVLPVITRNIVRISWNRHNKLLHSSRSGIIMISFCRYISCISIMSTYLIYIYILIHR